jgi:hypothetical protein
MSVLGTSALSRAIAARLLQAAANGNRRATRTETAAPVIKARALRLRHDNSAANERRI